MTTENYYLTLTCPNRPGIVAAVSTYIFELGGDIEEAQQFDDKASKRFFMRVSFSCSADSKTLRAGFVEIAKRFDLTWGLRAVKDLKRVLIMASKLDHCLVDLLYRWRIGELPMIICGIVSNHPRELYSSIDFADIPFYHLPVTAETKPAQEAKLLEIVADSKVDMVILARYMQILSDDLSTKLSGRCINVHHSFLPSFKGAKPYHQAHARGIKLIGATAHFVTSDLDEGPIIEQDVTRVTHGDTPEDLVRKGRDLERTVLSRALRYYLHDRVLINGATSVVFSD
ncbi:MAG: formyltetrahydrofolate deformylase [Polynucleobacter sp. 24-46-87]|jgi:formyltetrahydrofolate deformylase|uniref:formyltetrahydrofolate deformylase n=2 Tax=Polynucleobacter TaxID=44013 RepID=UPI000BD984C0|nr:MULTISPECIES: formyltetrahydrofolate deformylase [unclassified Polynucleobacter]OYY19449.1 MAG: formyltetrahydrofolate deformylase [Polynucleobacter sp. 35-46-11]OZA16287.1 MAG: formyltetrahydrofolate deformylase [Polynucleobacter sp. 24-46-87]OZA78143.1 MAG: formyltetrahydrofolate deformylase [Polynucleobacter sp. 39-46-10]